MMLHFFSPHPSFSSDTPGGSRFRGLPLQWTIGILTAALLLVSGTTSWAKDAEVRAFLVKIQQAELTTGMNEIFGIELPASGELADEATFQKLSELHGDLEFRGENVDRFLEVTKRAGEFLIALRSHPDVLAAHNQWSLSKIRPSGALRQHEVKPIYDLVGDDKFMFRDYVELVPKVSYLWNQMRARNMVDDFNLIFNEHITPDARVPLAPVRGHLMDIVGGYWGQHLDVNKRFNFLSTLREAATYYRELQSSPSKMARYNRKYADEGIPKLPQSGGIVHPRSREKLLSLAAEAVQKNAPLKRQLSGF